MKSCCAEDLGEEISGDDWGRTLERVHSSLICANHRVIRYKLVHRTYWTKMRLSKTYADVEPMNL